VNSIDRCTAVIQAAVDEVTQDMATEIKEIREAALRLIDAEQKRVAELTEATADLRRRLQQVFDQVGILEAEKTQAAHQLRHKEERISELTDALQKQCDLIQHRDKRVTELETINKLHCKDWADEDTEVKKLAAPYIGDFDGPRPPQERGLGFRGVVEVTEALCKRIAELTESNGNLFKIKQATVVKNGALTTRIAEMAKLLDICRHDVCEFDFGRSHYEKGPDHICPRCAWEKLKGTTP